MRLEVKEVDHQIEAYTLNSIKEVANVEDKVNEKAVRTYRQMQQSLEAVAFALSTTLQQLHKLSLDETRPEEQMAK